MNLPRNTVAFRVGHPRLDDRLIACRVAAAVNPVSEPLDVGGRHCGERPPFWLEDAGKWKLTRGGDWYLSEVTEGGNSLGPDGRADAPRTRYFHLTCRDATAEKLEAMDHLAAWLEYELRDRDA